MKYRVIFAPEAKEDFQSLTAFDRAAVRDAINTHLSSEPTRQSRSRIKRLQGVDKPQYRLRVGGIRIFYDVCETEVEVLGIVDKSRSAKWLEDWSER